MEYGEILKSRTRRSKETKMMTVAIENITERKSSWVTWWIKCGKPSRLICADVSGVHKAPTGPVRQGGLKHTEYYNLLWVLEYYNRFPFLYNIWLLFTGKYNNYNNKWSLIQHVSTCVGHLQVFLCNALFWYCMYVLWYCGVCTGLYYLFTGCFYRFVFCFWLCVCIVSRTGYLLAVWLSLSVCFFRWCCMCRCFPSVHMSPFVKCRMSTVYCIVQFVWLVSNMFCAQCRSGFRPTDRRQYFGSLL